LVGYSKGGAEAIAMALETGKDAVLFNPASYNWSKFGLDVEGYNGNMTSYIIEGEVLSETMAKKWDVPGEKKLLGSKNENYESIKRFLSENYPHIKWGTNVVSAVSKHFLSNFVSGK